MVEWRAATDTSGTPTREFRIKTAGRDITGAVWLPAEPGASSTLMCFGHGASGDRYQAPIPFMARRFVREARLPVLSIDGPVHGLRQVGEGGRKAFGPEFQRPECLTDMTRDWTLAIAAAQALPEIGIGKIAYFGLSMGSIFGIPLVASRQDVTVATLGLFGTQDNYPHRAAFLAAAGQIDCPLLFLMQLEDELFSREGYLQVFDAFASPDKRLHANPGLHPMVPAEEFNFAYDFIVSHIEGHAARTVRAVAE